MTDKPADVADLKVVAEKPAVPAYEKRFENLKKAIANKDKVAFWRLFTPPRFKHARMKLTQQGELWRPTLTQQGELWRPMLKTYRFLEPYLDAFKFEALPQLSKWEEDQLGDLKACKRVLEILRQVYNEKGLDAVLWLMVRGLAPPSERCERDKPLADKIRQICGQANLPQSLIKWYASFQQKVFDWEQSPQSQDKSSDTSGESASNAPMVEKQVQLEQQPDAPHEPQTPAQPVSQHIKEPTPKQGGPQQPDALPEPHASAEQSQKQAEGAEQDSASHQPTEVAAIAEDKQNELQAEEGEDLIKCKRNRDNDEEEGGVDEQPAQLPKKNKVQEQNKESHDPGVAVTVSPEPDHQPAWGEPLMSQTPFAATAINSIPACGGIIIIAEDGSVDLYHKECVRDGENVFSQLPPIGKPESRIWYQFEDVQDEHGNNLSEQWQQVDEVKLPYNYVLVILDEEWRHDWWSGYSILPDTSLHLSHMTPDGRKRE
jgi:hypothetical protein